MATPVGMALCYRPPSCRRRPTPRSPARSSASWYVVDADGETLGRLATRIADTLRGKRKPIYTPHVDTGDFVVVVNCERIRVTGNKLQEKRYYRHSGYPGGLRERTLAEQLAAPARGGHPSRRARDAPEEPARPRPAHEAEGLPRRRAPPRRPAAAAAAVAQEPHEVSTQEKATYRATGKRKTSVARVILTPARAS